MPPWGWWINTEYVQRLIKRFTLQDTAQFPEAFPLIKGVWPVTLVDSLLPNLHGQATGNIDISAASSDLIIFTVPQHKRWHLLNLTKSVTTGGSRMGIKSGAATPLYPGTYLQIAGTTEKADNLPQPYILNEGDHVIIRTTGNGGDTTRSFAILYMEENAF